MIDPTSFIYLKTYGQLHSISDLKYKEFWIGRNTRKISGFGTSANSICRERLPDRIEQDTPSMHCATVDEGVSTVYS
jgi:hypothetical protein